MRLAEINPGLPFICKERVDDIMMRVVIPPTNTKISPYVLELCSGRFRHPSEFAGLQWEVREDYVIVDVPWDTHIDEALFEDEAITEMQQAKAEEDAQDLLKFPPDDEEVPRIAHSIR